MHFMESPSRNLNSAALLAIGIAVGVGAVVIEHGAKRFVFLTAAVGFVFLSSLAWRAGVALYDDHLVSRSEKRRYSILYSEIASVSVKGVLLRVTLMSGRSIKIMRGSVFDRSKLEAAAQEVRRHLSTTKSRE